MEANMNELYRILNNNESEDGSSSNNNNEDATSSKSNGLKSKKYNKMKQTSNDINIEVLRNVVSKMAIDTSSRKYYRTTVFIKGEVVKVYNVLYRNKPILAKIEEVNTIDNKTTYKCRPLKYNFGKYGYIYSGEDNLGNCNIISDKTKLSRKINMLSECLKDYILSYLDLGLILESFCMNVNFHHIVKTIDENSSTTFDMLLDWKKYKFNGFDYGKLDRKCIWKRCNFYVRHSFLGRIRLQMPSHFCYIPDIEKTRIHNKMSKKRFYRGAQWTRIVTYSDISVSNCVNTVVPKEISKGKKIYTQYEINQNENLRKSLIRDAVSRIYSILKLDNKRFFEFKMDMLGDLMERYFMSKRNESIKLLRRSDSCINVSMFRNTVLRYYNSINTFDLVCKNAFLNGSLPNLDQIHRIYVD